MRFTRPRRLLAMAALAAPVALAAVGCQTQYGADLSRHADPVVLRGAAVPKLIGVAPAAVVGFAWDGTAWHQVPVQVDERDLVSPGQIYHLAPASWPKLSGTSTPYLMEVYTPPATLSAGYSSTDTYTPSDSNPNLDANDEVSFLSGSAGKDAQGVPAPAGVAAATREQVAVTDPLAPGEVGYVSLFQSTTPSLTGGSGGTTGVHYTFTLASGAYKATYKMGNSSLAPNNAWGFNPESSTVVTPTYTLGFSDRWVNDSLTITTAGASGADLLDRSMYYVPVGCGRTEDTFDGADVGEGAFVVNISGPVRAIRSVFGANSYAYTAKTDVFYPTRQTTTIQLQGHAGIPSYGAADDLTTNLTGLTYVDPQNLGGLPIDGSTDSSFVPTSFVTGSGAPPDDPWHLVRGAAGSLVSVGAIDTDIDGLTVTSFLQDTYSPTTAPCTGDAHSWGKAGINVLNMPFTTVTDPTLTANPKHLTTYTTRIFAGPDLGADRAAGVSNEVTNPLQVSVTG